MYFNNLFLPNTNRVKVFKNAWDIYKYMENYTILKIYGSKIEKSISNFCESNTKNS